MSLLDGELRFHQRWIVRRHVRRCWECRARRQELEQSVRQLVRLKEDHEARLRGVSSVAKRRFQGWRNGCEQRRRPIGRGRIAKVAAVASAVVVAIVVGFIAVRRTQPSPASLEPILARARQAETRLLAPGAVVRQEFSVEIAQVRPVRKTRQSSLEVWADGDRRYAARWAEPQGKLKFAAWQPASRRRYVFEGDDGPGRVVLAAGATGDSVAISECVASAADDQAIERGFLRWLHSRRWSPVLLGQDMAEMHSGSGEGLRLERLESDGVSIVRASAWKTGRGVEVQLLFEIDPATEQIRVQQIRIRQGAREAFLRIALRNVRFIPVREESLVAGTFEPPLARPPAARIEPVPVELPAAPVASGVRAPDEILESRVELLDLLHRIGAEMGEELAIGRRPDGGLIIEGMLDSPRRRLQIEALVRSRMQPDLVTLRLVDSETGWSAPDEFRSLAWTPPAFSQPMKAEGLAIGDLIESTAGVLESGRAEDYLGRLAELHWSAVTEVWSLRMLSQVVLPWEEARLTEPSRDRLRRMIESHRLSLIDAARSLRAHLRPLTGRLDEPVQDCARRASANWQEEADWIFRASQPLNNAFQRLTSLQRGAATADPGAEVVSYLAHLDCVVPDSVSPNR